MSNTQTNGNSAAKVPSAAMVDTKLEAIVIPVSDVDRANGRINGPEPHHASYLSFATFSDPDGNSWLLQEVRTRRPGRGLDLGVATLTTLLREAEEQHGAYERAAPTHHWSGWYAAYAIARERGGSAEEEGEKAARHVEHLRR